MTGITKRTIDYYTSLGLLEAERSSSNYRYYTSEAINRLHEIEEMKTN
ncbi:MerR family transcriptional regulator, partial [Butyricicoccus sp. 1XD8-22]